MLYEVITVQEFFKKDNSDTLNKINKDDLGWALIYATENGHLPIVQEFFKKDRNNFV